MPTIPFCFAYSVFCLLFWIGIPGGTLLGGEEKPSLSRDFQKSSVSAEAVLLMNAETGVVLYEKNGYVEAFPASTTKIATALYVLEKHPELLEGIATASREAIASITPEAKIQSNYRSPPYWIETGSTHIGIKLGEEFALPDLLAAVLIASANDASNVLAQQVAGKIPAFMEAVNGYLKEIGCHHTHFVNPHGLHHPCHKTTPYDLAKMAQLGLRNPRFRQLVSTPSYPCPQTNLSYERTFLSTNLLLRKGALFYPKAIGIKTGTTLAAGKNLVAAATEGGRTLILVLMGHRGPRQALFEEATALFEHAFHEPKLRRYLLPKGATSFTTVRSGRTLHTILPEGVFYDFYPSEEVAVQTRLCWKIPPLPLAEGTRVGTLEVITTEGGHLLQQVPVLAAHPLAAPLWDRLLRTTAWKPYLICGGVAIVLGVVFKRLRRTRRRTL